jgi:hypothetical protein
MKKKEQGMVTVEIALIAVALFIVLFAVMELARIIWIWNTADEATRRGARVAAVCPINHPAIAEATIFAQAGTGGPSPILRGLETGNVDVAYLGEDGNKIPGNPAFGDIRYVRVFLKNYSVTPLIPFVDTTFNLPPFETTIPSESLGLDPTSSNPSPYCTCFGLNSPGPTTNCEL